MTETANQKTAVSESMPVEPIGPVRQSQVRDATCDCISRAGDLFGRNFAQIPVLFDLSGRAAGMYRVRRCERVIRYNPWLFARYYDDNLVNTVPHEVAHYVCDLMYGIKRIKPHGPEWRAVMTSLGAAPMVTGRYDLAGIPSRRQRRHTYRCDCTTHELTSVRHNRIQSGRTHYYCRLCKSTLRSE